MRYHRVLFAVGCCLLNLSIATASHAQSAEGFKLDRFTPSERGSQWFALDSLDLQGNGRVAFGTVGTWARNPLVIRDARGNVITPIVEDQLIIHAGANVILEDRFRIGVNLPVGAYQTGERGQVAGSSLPPPQGTAIGDARLSADARIVGTYRGPFTSSLGLEVTAPTGNRDAYMSDEVFGVTPRALAAGRIGLFDYAGRLGVNLRPVGHTYAGTEAGSSIVFGAAAGATLASERVHLGAELFGSTAIGDAAFGSRSTPLELLFGGHARVLDDVLVGLGIGPGLTRGDGSPELRGLASVQWAPRHRPKAAPAPLPVEPPPAPPEPAPVVMVIDRDSDGIDDVDDVCPDSAGPIDADPLKSGCPVAELSGDMIRIRDQILFHERSAELDQAGDATLAAVTELLVNHPELTRVRVEGHTDAFGPAQQNAALSTARARAVVAWLSKHGIDAQRLEAQGYGAERPLSTNSTEEGRRINRRVEFHVTAKTDELARAERDEEGRRDK